MAAFGARSLKFLDECHPDLQRVAHEAIRHYDFSVYCGHRGQAEQEAAFKSGHSNARFGQSPHNFDPSRAFDAAPFPIDWDDIKRFNELGEVIKQAGLTVGVPVTWGGDFKSLKDRPHFELTNWRNL